jgi:hypothetical protein
VDVPRGDSARDVVLRLSAAGAALRGRVTAANGAPVRGATVTVTEVGSEGGVFALAAGPAVARAPAATTDATGAFVLERLAAASYEVHVAHPDFAPATVSDVARNDETTPLDVVLGAGGTLEGQTKPGVLLTLGGEAWSTMLSSDESGSFKVERVPAGTYLLRAVTTDERITAAPDVQRRTVRIVEGQVTTVDLVDEAPQTRRVVGRVAAPAKGEVALVLLRLPGSPPPNPADLIFQGSLGLKNAEESRYVVAEALAQGDGSFALVGVPPGRYTQEVYATSVLGTLTGQPASLKERKEIVVE